MGFKAIVVSFLNPEQGIFICSFSLEASVEKSGEDLRCLRRGWGRRHWGKMEDMEKRWLRDLFSVAFHQTEAAIFLKRCWPFPETTAQETEKTLCM